MMSDPHMCRVCGGPFSQKRIWIDGNQYHERCAMMSYPTHTHADYTNLSDDLSRLMGAVQALRAVWFEGADINHGKVAAECLKVFAIANSIGTSSRSLQINGGLAMSDLVERLRSNEPLPFCPYDSRSPEYRTAPDDKPCKVCGGLNDINAPDLCRGADTRLFKEAADELDRLQAEVKRWKTAYEQARDLAEVAISSNK